MRFASLGSGSKGNATLIQASDTLLLIDNGFSLKETCKRLANFEKTPSDLNGILVTHEHGDHVAGVGKLARKYNIPVWLTEGTRKASEKSLDKVSDIRIFHNHETFEINDIEVNPVTVPHDAREPSQFTFNNGNQRIGVLTDVGSITPHIISEYHGCDGLLLESNHDAQMLAQSVYPQHLKHRISGRLGHLENQQAAGLLTKIDTSKLKHIVAAHLSDQNNCTARVKQALSTALNCEQSWIGIAEQQSGLDWRDCS